MNEIILGDCLEVMKTFPDNHFSGIVTDPPYGLKFMGKEWDHDVPGIMFWQETLRISKPGAYSLVFGGTRKFHRMAANLEDAGWEIRDCVCWLYGSGFPKSHNHFGIEGYGTALKPAWEPCIVAMKPLDGTFKKNTEKWGQAGINIDGSRVGAENIVTQLRDRSSWHGNNYGSGGYEKPMGVSKPRKGRWPANLILDEEAAVMLDEQSGVLRSGSHKPLLTEKKNAVFGKYKSANPYGTYEASSGGASRFFYTAKASSRERNEGLDGFPNIECQAGCGGAMPIDDKRKERDRFKKIAKNPHPTVKPLSLMRYLITLIAPPQNALILDPFAGSGSTIVAAQELGIQAIGIEKEAEYAEIARARVAHTANKVQKVVDQMELFE